MQNETTRLNPDDCWQAVASRDPAADSTFVYAVHSTKIYCRPTCPSRRPRRDGVSFYANGSDAKAAGYRACKRCQPDLNTLDELEWVKQVCGLIDANLGGVLTLDMLGVQLNISPGHLQKVFKRVMGVTPRQYAEAKRRERFQSALKTPLTVTASLYEAGYNSSSGFYENGGFGMTPRTYKQGGQGEQIAYTINQTALGCILIAATDKGVCAVRLGDTPDAVEAELRTEFPAAALSYDKSGLEQYANLVSAHIAGENPHLQLPLDLKATAFQAKVWHALQAIPYGETRSYRDIAIAIGQPAASRAVANAIAHNPVALAIPCHRVIGSDGSLTGYRWGLERKEALLNQETHAHSNKESYVS